MRPAQSIKEVVTSGLCIGCGLCESLTKSRVKMMMTQEGGLRPNSVTEFSETEEALLLSSCPGVHSEARIQTTENVDEIWGNFSSMRYAWAETPEVRYRAATGGVLTSLGQHLLESGQVNFILHVSSDPRKPMRNRWVISETSQEVLERCGSRYSPVSPLAGLMVALERKEAFAIIAKPCDLGAVYALAQTDQRVDQFCKFRLAMVCGGQSRLKKSQGLLQEFGVSEEELRVFRYRGYGNPGLTTVGTNDGRTFTKTYQELWEDEGSWELETRCKLCTDPLGEAADIAAADVWPGGGPTGEDEGFNGIIVRSHCGEELAQSAAKAGKLHLGKEISPRQFDNFQPHQVRKKHAILARLEGMNEAGLPSIATKGLRLEELSTNLSREDREWQISGVKKRVSEGRIIEELPDSDSEPG